MMYHFKKIVKFCMPVLMLALSIGCNEADIKPAPTPAGNPETQPKTLVTGIDSKILLPKLGVESKYPRNMFGYCGFDFTNKDPKPGEIHSITIAVCASAEQANKIFEKTIATITKPALNLRNTSIGDRRLDYSTEDIFIRDNVFVQVSFKDNHNLKLVKQLDEFLQTGKHGVTRGQFEEAPRLDVLVDKLTAKSGDRISLPLSWEGLGKTPVIDRGYMSHVVYRTPDKNIVLFARNHTMVELPMGKVSFSLKPSIKKWNHPISIIAGAPETLRFASDSFTLNIKNEPKEE